MPHSRFAIVMLCLVSLSPSGKNPSMQGERIGVKRGPNGDWVMR